MEHEKPDYHLNNGNEPQSVEHDSQQYQSGTTPPKEGDIVAAKGNDIEVTKEMENAESTDYSGFSAGKYDWDFALKESAIPVQRFSELYEKNKEQVAGAEMALGEKAEAIYKSCSEQFDLDSELLKHASNEELEELNDAIKKSKEIQDSQQQLLALDQQIDKVKNDTTENLGGIWKNKWSVDISDYPSLEASIPAKQQWLEENKPYGWEQKVAALEGFADGYAKYQKLIEEKNDLEEGSPKGSLSDYEKVISKYQDKSSLYSIHRKNKAVWCKDIWESEKEFVPTAKKQRINMTHEELTAIQDYTGSGSSTINRPLNAIGHSSGWGASGKAKAKKECRKMTAALDKCASDKDVWLQRGVSELHMGGIDFSDLLNGKTDIESLIGREFINNSFMSCGSAKGTGFVGKGLTMNIYCPKGTKMHYVEDITSVSGENETIIQRGYHFKITKITKKGHSYYMDVDLLLGSDADRLTDKQVDQMYDKYL